MKHVSIAACFCLAALVPVAAAAQAAQDTESLPPWEQLTPAQREELVAPMRERWNRDPAERARMAERARRWRAMPPEQRQRAHRGMQRWEHMDPARRAQMRALFERTRDMPRERRRETMALFRAMLPMTPAEREQLTREWTTMTPEQRRAWLREHAPRRGMQGSPHDRGGDK